MPASQSAQIDAGEVFVPWEAFLQSTRPGASLVAGTLSAGVAMVKTGFHLQGLLAGTCMWCVTAFGFVINDILDYEKDSASSVQRPVAMGKLSRRRAAIFALFLLLVAFGISALLGAGGWVLTATAIALVLYTPAARHLPLFKGIYVAALCVTPLYYATVVVNARYSLLFYGPLTMFIFGRETLMDAHEMEGDRMAGLVTLAAAVGQTGARWIGACLMAAALAWLAIVTESQLGRIAGALSFVLVLLVLMWPRLDESRRVALSRVPMFAAALAIAFG